MLPDPFSHPHKEKREKAVRQRETKTTYNRLEMQGLAQDYPRNGSSIKCGTEV